VIFLLSPASCRGRRAEILLSERASFELAQRLRSPAGAALGDVFSFLSGLYFRGKLAYARAFAAVPDRVGGAAAGGIFVITPDAGLQSPEASVTPAVLRRFAAVEVSAANPAYRGPLERSAQALAAAIGAERPVVLLGSIASAKYVDVLESIFGDRLLFPQDFVGRGDMSRGGLLLRCAAARQPMTYVPVAGAVRHGARPPKLDPATRVPSSGRRHPS
jgi:hypothetical protein